MIDGRRPAGFTEPQLRWLAGVSVAQFSKLVVELGPVWNAEHARRSKATVREAGAGRPFEMVFATRLFVCLVYLRWNVSFRGLGAMVGFSKDTVNRAVHECTQLLAEYGITRPSGDRITDLAGLEEALVSIDHNAMVDGTFVVIQRPGGGWEAQKAEYSGHRHRHCRTTQVMTDGNGALLWVTDSEPGPTHDSTAFVSSGVGDLIVNGDGILVADRGYRGMDKRIEGLDLLVPICGGPKGPGTWNTAHASLRVKVEHAIRTLKRRQILHGYRRLPDRLNDTIRATATLATLRA